MRFAKIETVVVCLLVSLLRCAPVAEAQGNPHKSKTISGSLSPATSTAGSTVALSGTANVSTTADANGNYSFTGLASGSYTVTPSKAGLRFQPASQSVNVKGSSSSMTVNFAATPMLQSITISAASASIAKGVSDQFTATGTFSDGTTQNLTNSVTWVSSNTSVATISASGLASGVGAGSASIMAALSGITSNSFALNVAAATLQSISISAGSSSIAKGASVQFTATGTFSDGSTQNLTSTATWASSSLTTVNISATGFATGAAVGSSNITATQNGITSNSFALTVTAATLQSITISATSSSIPKGTSVQFTATGTFSDGSTQNLTNTATWNSSSTATVNISTAGLATGTAIGSSNITATQNGITSNTFALTVTAATLQSISISSPKTSIAKGTSVQFTATGTFSDGSTQNLTNTATWASSSQTSVNISATGLATGAAIGSSNITATQNGITSNSLALTVTAATLQSIAVNAGSLSVAKGTSVQFTATGTFSDGSTQNLTNSATWASSNSTAVNISASGLATGAAIGSSNITATQSGVTSNSFALAVTAATLQSINVSASSSSIAKGTTVQFTATGTFSDSSTQNLTNTATWGSSSQATVNISATGLATGASIGSSNITATQGGISSNSFALTVTAPALQSISVTAPNNSLSIGLTEQFTATGTFSDGSTQNLTSTASWSSSNPAAATIGTSGIATAAGVGQTSISAVQGGITGSVTLSVTAVISGALTSSGALATVTLSGAASSTTTADSSGNYSFSGIVNGAYTITPTKTGVTFTPTSQNVTINGSSNTAVNFTATLPAWTISGTLSPASDTTGATVTLSGAASATTTAGANGSYSFSGIANGTYTVTPTKTGYNFNPASQQITVSNAAKTGVNFATVLVITISPISLSLQASGTQQFTATITGSSNTSVNWTATGGTISASGLYTAGNTAGTFAVTATSVADPTKSASATVTVTTATGATGPLRPLANNPRWFTDGSGKAIFLSGSHTWNTFQDTDQSTSPAAFDFTGYVNFLKSHGHNVTILWKKDLPTYCNWGAGGTWHMSPFPWQRTGGASGTQLASDGLKAFDLSLFDQSYFDRLRARTIQLQQNGIYAIVELFDGLGITANRCSSDGYPFSAGNNVNGVSDDNATSSLTMSSPNNITNYQDAFVQKVIDTLNDLPNVLWEISEEAPDNSTWWQNHMISLIHTYEAGKSLQHPVGFPTLNVNGASDSTLYNSNADWVAPDAKISPTSSCGSGTPACKVNINDSDHSYFGMWNDSAQTNRNYLWENFANGNGVIFMDPYFIYWSTGNRNLCHNPVNGVCDGVDTRWDNLRNNMGAMVSYANRMNLSAMTPQPSLSSTGYGLVNAGVEYLVYEPGSSGSFTVTVVPATYAFEWFNPNSLTVVSTGTITVSAPGNQSFTKPFSGDAVLYLKVQ